MSIQVQPSSTAGSSQIIDFPIWKTILLSTGLTKESFLKNYSNPRKEYFLGDIISGIQFLSLTLEHEVDLVLVSIEDLGLTGQWPLSGKDVCVQAQKLGLSLCPSEVGPQLCLQECAGLQEGEQVEIGTEPVNERILAIWESKGKPPSLHNPLIRDTAVRRWIFVKPRK